MSAVRSLQVSHGPLQETPMNARHFALIAGAIYVVVAVAGFIPALLQPVHPDAPPVHVDALHGRLFGLFPVNILHTLVHLAIGLWGLAAARGLAGSILYARALAVIYAALALMGLLPVLNTLFGLVPLYGHDVWLHAGTAAVAAFFGWSPAMHRDPRA
jgi:hypothetical protein